MQRYLISLRAIAAPTLVAALALLLILTIPWRRGERWALWAVPLGALGWGVPTLVVAFSLHRSTGASTPWPALVVSTRSSVPRR